MIAAFLADFDMQSCSQQQLHLATEVHTWLPLVLPSEARCGSFGATLTS